MDCLDLRHCIYKFCLHFYSSWSKPASGLPWFRLSTTWSTFWRHVQWRTPVGVSKKGGSRACTHISDLFVRALVLGRNGLFPQFAAKWAAYAGLAAEHSAVRPRPSKYFGRSRLTTLKYKLLESTLGSSYASDFDPSWVESLGKCFLDIKRRFK